MQSHSNWLWLNEEYYVSLVCLVAADESARTDTETESDSSQDSKAQRTPIKGSSKVKVVTGFSPGTASLVVQMLQSSDPPSYAEQPLPFSAASSSSDSSSSGSSSGSSSSDGSESEDSSDDSGRRSSTSGKKDKKKKKADKKHKKGKKKKEKQKKKMMMKKLNKKKKKKKTSHRIQEREIHQRVQAALHAEQRKQVLTQLAAKFGVSSNFSPQASMIPYMPSPNDPNRNSDLSMGAGAKGDAKQKKQKKKKNN